MKFFVITILVFITASLPSIDYHGGNCLEFDGIDDFVEISNEISLTAEYSIEFWFKTSTTNQTMDMLTCTISNNHGILFEFKSNNDLRFLHRNPPGSTGGANLNISGNYNDGQWHHIAAEKYNTYLDIYIDGYYEGDFDGLTDFTNPLTFLIGKLKPNSSERFFEGHIDELRIWSETRGEEQIQKDMNFTLPGNTTNLLAYWQFNETSDSIAYDSVNSNNGTLMNMTDDDWVESNIPVFAHPQGSGTVGDPYQISNLGNLIWLSEHNNYWDKHYIQTDNIEAIDTNTLNNGEGLRTIGTYAEAFTGSYDGQNFVIDNLYINSNVEAVGLFGRTNGVEISNLGVTNVEIVSDWSVGVLVGVSSNSTIDNCFCTGSIDSNGGTGGLIGDCGDSTISSSYVIVNITTGDQSGGFLGSTYQDDLSNCYCAGSISGTSEIGGFIGFGNLSTTITSCFWDIDATGQSTSEGGIGKTTSEMKTRSTFLDAGWDFLYETANGTDDNWGIFNELNSGYPILTTFYSVYPSILSTIPVIPVMNSTVKIGGNITQDGNSSVIAKGICWSTSPNPALIDSYSDEGAGTDEFYSTISGLDSATQYYYRVYATNSWGTAYGEEYYLIPENNAGFCMEFDGVDDYLDFQDITIPKNIGTIEYWVKNSSEYDIHLYTSDNGTSDRNGFGGMDVLEIHTALDAEGKSFFIYQDGHTDVGRIEFSGTTDLRARNGWYHIAVTYDTSGMMRLYVDGVEEASADMTTKTFSGKTQHYNYFGKPVENSRFFDGTVDEIRIWNDVRTETEITDNMDKIVSNDEADLIGYLYLNESSGTRAYDIVNENHGTLHNMTDEDWIVSDCPLNKLPNITTTIASINTTSSANSGGNVLEEGFSEVTSKGVCWSTSPNPALDDSYTLDGNGEGEYVSLLSGLEYITEYFYRAYATNSYGTAYGEEYSFTTPQFDGSGSEIDPYQITNLVDLKCLSENSFLWDKHFIQTADIDATDTQNWNGSEGFRPMGNHNDNYFLGSYDGQDFAIDNLYINRPSESYLGLFGCPYYGAVIKNLNLYNIEVTGDNFVGGVSGNLGDALIENCFISGSVNGRNCGGIVGYSEAGEISDCINYANINGDVCGGIVGYGYGSIINNCINHGNIIGVGSDHLGGIVGNAFLNFTITNCCNYGTVEGDSTVGGLAGEITGGDIIENSINFGTVSGETKIGGVCGLLFLETNPNNGYIKNCYNKGSISGLQKTGGLVGECIFDYNIENCYSSGSVTGSTETGGFIGSNTSSSIKSCFWDINTSGQTTSAGGIGLTTNGMHDILNYLANSWDFQGETINGDDDIWGLNPTENDGYPFLSWQNLFHTVQTDFTPAGNGTEVDPYQISNLENLYWISNTNSTWDKHFIQTADIDADDTQNWNNGEGFSPIGVGHDNYFSGRFDGQNFLIEGLYINRPNLYNIGLFGSIDGADLSNINLENIQINGLNSVGGLVGLSLNSNIEECHISGNIFGVSQIASLIGTAFESNAINNCSTIGLVSGDCEIGGLAGYTDMRNTFEENYSNVTINGDSYLGGLIGYSDHHLNNIENCYSIGTITGISYIGGLIGATNIGPNYINNCYSACIINGNSFSGGLIGDDDNFSNSISNSFWDTETSGQSNSAGGTGKTTAEMNNITTFTDLSTTGLDEAWDFFWNPNDDDENEDIWGMNDDDNNGYPFLMWQGYIPQFPYPENVDIQVAGNEVNISWDEVPGANSYKIFAADSPDGTFEDVTSSGTFSRCNLDANRDTPTKERKINSPEKEKSRSLLIWTAPFTGNKKFYYVVASTETSRILINCSRKKQK